MVQLEIGAFIAALSSGAFGAVGVAVFEGSLPDSPVDAIAVIASGGGPNLRSFGRVEWTQPTCQILIRRSTMRNAETAANALADAFNSAANFPATISGAVYRSADTIQPPYLFEQDAKGGRTTFAFNVELKRG